MKMLFLAFLLATSACASEMDQLVQNLGDEDFDVREKATWKLSEYPEDCIKKFLIMAETEPDPEIKYRLVIAAKLLYAKKIAVKSDDWLLLYGKIGFDGHIRYQYRIEIDMTEQVRRWVRTTTCYVVSNLDPAVIKDKDERIQNFDVVTEIKDLSDGSTVTLENIRVKAGVEYEVTIRRYKDLSELMKEEIPSQEDTNFVESKVKIKAGWLDNEYVDHDAEERIVNAQWKAYYEGYKNAGLPKERGN